MPTFNVNNKEVIRFTARLEKLHRSAFPSAVRNTLNEAAFRDKQLIPKTASKKFVTRNKSFFKAFTGVNKATGWNVNKMQSKVGLLTSKGSKVVNGLAKQEFGGVNRGRKLLAHTDARISKQNNKRVSNRNKFNKGRIHNATLAYKRHKGTRKSKFISAVMSTAKSGKKRMLLTNGNKGMVYQVTSLSTNIKTKSLKFKLKKIYSYRSNPYTTIKATHFMSDSAKVIHKQISQIYKEKAEFQFKKAMKR